MLNLLHRSAHKLRGDALSPQAVIHIRVVYDIHAVALGECYFPNLLVIIHYVYPVFLSNVFHPTSG